jgi:hypothetical protein
MFRRSLRHIQGEPFRMLKTIVIYTVVFAAWTMHFQIMMKERPRISLYCQTDGYTEKLSLKTAQ